MKNQMASVLMHILEADFVSVRDESHLHAGHRGTHLTQNSHFAVAIVSEKFRDVSRVKSHQMVYKTLKFFIDEGVHALSIDPKAE